MLRIIVISHRISIRIILKFVKKKSLYLLRSWKLSSTDSLCRAYNFRSGMGPLARVGVRNFHHKESYTGKDIWLGKA